MYDVTQEEYQRVMGVNPSEFSATGKQKDKVAGQDTKRFPVENVSWEDAVEFCRKLSEMPEEKAAGRWYRLPSEAQWEYACRAGSTGRFSFSSGRSGIPREYEEHELSDYGWFGGNSGGRRMRWAGSEPMHGDCTICMATCGSGARTGMTRTIMRSRLRTIRRGLPEARAACFAAVAGATRRGSAGPRDRFNVLPGDRDISLGFRASLVLPETAAERAKMSLHPDTTQFLQPLPPTNRHPSRQAPILNPPVSSPRRQFPGRSRWQMGLPPCAPPPAVAPFDEKKAKEHQQGWAKHLGVPVEQTNSIGMKLVLIPPGEFMMGSTQEEVDQLLKDAKEKNYDHWYIERLPAEAPRHRVRLTKPLYLGVCEVTVGAFRRFVDETGYTTDAEKDGKGGFGRDEKGGWVQKPEFVCRNPGFTQTDANPVVNVGWNDAAAFCQWLSRKDGKEYRLPTEGSGNTPAGRGAEGSIALGTGRVRWRVRPVC